MVDLYRFISYSNIYLMKPTKKNISTLRDQLEITTLVSIFVLALMGVNTHI